MKFKQNKIVPIVAVVFAMLFSARPVRATAEADVRQTVQRVFNQLKSRDYSGLYEVLPAASRAKISRERFTAALSRAQDMYVLDRMEVGAVRIAGDIAAVDTVLYGRVVNPLQLEGKIVVQQYLVREDGQWKVATGDRPTVQRFLAANPAFARKFPIRQPKIFVKQNGKWIEFKPPRRR